MLLQLSKLPIVIACCLLTNRSSGILLKIAELYLTDNRSGSGELILLTAYRVIIDSLFSPQFIISTDAKELFILTSRPFKLFKGFSANNFKIYVPGVYVLVIDGP